MTTATRAPRKLKLYGPDMSNAFPPRAVLEAVGAARHRVQAPYTVAAYTKADAVRYLEAAGFRVDGNGRHLRVQAPVVHDLTALLDAGLLATEGEIVAWTDRGGVESVRGIVTVHPGGEVRVWGNWQLTRFHIGGRPVKYVTFAVRRADGARFPERTRTGQEPTPPTGWTMPADWTERDSR